MSERTLTAAVVDDEPAAREAVITFLREVDGVEVVTEARNGTEAVERVRTHGPDLLFLDVQMPGLTGFDVLEELGEDVPPGVVFVTAHGEFALRAFEVHAVDYVTKPFGRPRFMAAVERAVRRLRAADALDHRSTIESVLEMMRRDVAAPAAVSVPSSPGGAAADVSRDAAGGPLRLGVRLGNRTTLVDVSDIDWIEADGDLVRLHVGDRTHLLRSTLKDLSATVGQDDFVRIHRSVLVQLARIRTLQREPDGSGSVTLDSGVSLRVARGRWERLEQRLGLRPASEAGS